MTLDALLTLFMVLVGLYVGWLKLGDSLRIVWAGVKRFQEARELRRSARANIMSRRETEPDTHTGTTSGFDTTAPADLTDREIVEALAGLKRADKYRFSANTIYALVGGSRNDVLAWVRGVRSPEADEPPPAQLPEQPHIHVPAYESPPA